MNNDTKAGKFERYASIIRSGIAMAVSLSILIAVAFAWFTSSLTPTTTGPDLSAVEQPVLTVRAESGAELDALTVEQVTTADDAERLLVLSVDDAVADTRMAPGISGEFTAYVTATGASSVVVSPQVCAGGITVTRENGQVSSFVNSDAYREDTTAGEQARADGYMQGHILMFRQKSADGIYSDWIDPFATNTLALESGVETEFPVYWVWVESYSMLHTPDLLIEADTLQQIRGRFFDNLDDVLSYNSTAAQHLFDSRSGATAASSVTQLSHFYDFADEDIGVTVKNIYFKLTFAI